MSPVFWRKTSSIDPVFSVCIETIESCLSLLPTELMKFGGMAGRSRRAWFSVLLGLVVGFTLASRLILPKASELKKAGQKRKANSAGCGLNGGLGKEYGGVLWPEVNGSPPTEKSASRSNNFLFVGVMTAQKYLNNRAVAAHRYVTPLTEQCPNLSI